MKQALTAQDILAAAQGERENILTYRRTIHRDPEVGSPTPRTAAYIAGELKKLGYQPQALGGGLVAAITGKDTGRCVLLRADMDALGEETPLGRIGRAEEAARAIFYLASEQSAFVTGQVLQVDGGMVI